MRDPNDLIDNIYEAALVPEHWPTALGQVAETIGAEGAVVFTTNFQRVSHWSASASINQVMQDWLAAGWHLKAERTRRMVGAGHPGFITEQHIFTAEELAADPEHREFLKPRGLGGIAAGTYIPMPSGDVVVYSVERGAETPLSAEDIGRLDELRPHLARAGALGARVGLDHARTAAETFKIVGLPAASLGSKGKVLAANSLFEALMPKLVHDRLARLTLVDDAADALLSTTLNAPLTATETVRSIPIAAADDMPPHVIHLLPVVGSAHDIFAQVSWICLAVPVVPRDVPGAELLQGLFDLTPAEARVARAIGAARPIDTIAKALGVSALTVRTQLKAVFAKTGVRGQAELVRLLGYASLPGQGASFEKD
ncbi:bacterial regulatory proteins, luxR family [Variibacter gotjawalensis]|uniref:Bacterial regulatory proteins, luxR family n=1 Tax=Variibacter gotjawalensis TaxID=1333996 RepID=A0A0S3PYS1_9BRAD|nr:helix-turn-helix transcriptional regulator [Variibacter gotjawalensis]NIK46899.1 DNA-binding CsgD family transcriptional regulator [Variibacter gotjawalensis]RZS48803.1 DNA-binding CsgD family transcriptional regulator [Variibacter gotjawalensis]BAT61062.1 bacterial regulatory proteins, luxR family [Variibacter gotjawalensis]